MACMVLGWSGGALWLSCGAGTLTVRENLWFSASLRLPQRMSHDQRSDRVEVGREGAIYVLLFAVQAGLGLGYGC